MKKTGLIIAGVAFLLLFVWAFQSEGKGKAPKMHLAHYIVFELEQGQIKPVKHQFAQISAPTDWGQARRNVLSFEKFGDLAKDLFDLDLKNQNGEVIFEDVVEVPIIIRAEFHGANNGIDGYEIEPDKTAFVARVPVIDGAKKLLLKRHQYQAESGSGQESQVLSDQPVFEFDLEELAGGQIMEMPAVPGPAPDTLILGGEGNSANRVDILIMGDGYTIAERDKFFSDAKKIYNGLLEITPHQEYKNFVKGVALYVQSAQSGADHPPYDPNCTAYDNSCCREEAAKYDPKAPKYVDTALGSSFCWGGSIWRALCSDMTLVLNAAAAVPDWDRIIVIVNDDSYGGTGGYISTISTHQLIVQVAQHEHGHSFAGLADEYDYGCTQNCLSWCPYENNSQVANATCKTNREEIRWNPWILPSTPIPTPWSWSDTQYEGLVGLFEGAMYTTKGVYRPKARCMMRDLSEFCPICRQEYVLKLYGGWYNGVPKDGIDLIEPGSENPVPGDITVNSGQSVNFSATLLKPAGSEIDISWHIDGIAIEGAKSNSFTFTLTKSGITRVELKVKDMTPLVHPAMAKGSLEHSRVWQMITDSVSAPVISGPTGGVIGKLFQFSASGQKCSLGHDVQFLFDWGDGTDSGWLAVGIVSASKSWSAPGTYNVRVKARCSVHQGVVSEWSAARQVVIFIPKLDVSVSISGKAGKPKKITVIVKEADTNKIVIGAQAALSGLVNQAASSNKKGKVVFKKIIGQGSLTIRVTWPGFDVWEKTFQIL